MLIGIIGAGISGLTAGRILAKAGHEVIVFEKSRGFGGRLSTRYSNKYDDVRYDHGAPYISGLDSRLYEFLKELEGKGILKLWTDEFHFHDGEELYNRHPNRSKTEMFCAPEGLNSIGRYLSRWSDVRRNTKAIGFTYMGDKRGKKKPWMINLQSSEAIEVDAIIVATPAVQTYGLIENSTDETMFKTVIKDIDTVNYRPKHTLMLTYENAPPQDYKGIICANNPVLHFISNESSKRDTGDKLSLAVQSNGDFSKKHIFDENPDDQIISEMVTALRKLFGDWAGKYDEANLKLWRYSQPGNHFETDFVELGSDYAPVALIGDFMKGDSIEHAFASGYELGHHWAKKLTQS